MKNKTRYLVFSLVFGVLYVVILLLTVFATANEGFGTGLFLPIFFLLLTPVMAGTFSYWIAMFINTRSIVHSLELENLFAFGTKANYFNLFAFEQRANAYRRNPLYANKPHSVIAFSASEAAAGRGYRRNDELVEINGKIAFELTKLFAKRGGKYDHKRHFFCFDRGTFLLYVIDRTDDQIEELMNDIRGMVYSILEQKRYHVFVQLFFGVAPASSETTLLESVDNAILARDNAENNFQTFSFYDPEFRRDVNAGGPVQEVIDAFNNGEFVVYYQPKFSLTKKEFISSEALIRWHSPEHGVLPPSKFMERIDAAGLLHELDNYVFQNVCADLEEAIKKGRRVLPVSINFSLYEFYSLDFLSSLIETVNKHNITPDLIEIEITETTTQVNQFLSLSIIKKLKEKGFRILMDDFGVGYSNIGNLRRIPFDAIKIDKSFIDDIVTDEKARELVKYSINLGRSAGLEVIAEGVDSTEQVDILRRAKCDTIQGFYYSRALPKDQYDAFLRENPFEGGKKK